MQTVALRKADGIVKMIVMADDNGAPMRMTKAAATLLAAQTEKASVSHDNYTGHIIYDKKGRIVKYVYPNYFVRVRP